MILFNGVFIPELKETFKIIDIDYYSIVLQYQNYIPFNAVCLYIKKA